MQKSGFFNSMHANGEYDRKYNANDYTDNLAVVIGNGVLRSENDDLKVTANGMVCTVAVGRAWINGHYYYNDTAYSFAAVSAPAGGSRYDRIVLRLNNNVATRSVALAYIQGTAANNPTKPALTRSGSIYEICLADVYVGTNATSVTVTDNRADADLCGWVYSTSGDNSFFTSLDNSFNEWFDDARDTLSSVTLFKRYIWRTVLQSTATQVQFVIPQYDADTCFIEVYVNGNLEYESVNYTVSGTVITFSNALISGTEVIANCYKSIDGTGINSVADEITELQNQVATITSVAEYDYDCTGLNDNISLSQIAQAIYSGSYVSANVTVAAAAWLSAMGGNTWLASLSTDAQITINVVGNLSVSTAFSGAGTLASPYKWFLLGQDNRSDKQIVFDFSKCNRIEIWLAASTENRMIYGTDLNIKNLNISVKSNGAGCGVQMISSRYNNGSIKFENCRLRVSTTGKAVIAENGDFINCYVNAQSSASHSLLFMPSTDGLIRLFGGTYYAYRATSGMTSAIVYVYATETNAVCMAYNINCPTKALTNFVQSNLLVAYAGKTIINGVVTTLNSTGTEGTYSITGSVAKNKAI